VYRTKKGESASLKTIKKEPINVKKKMQKKKVQGRGENRKTDDWGNSTQGVIYWWQKRTRATENLWTLDDTQGGGEVFRGRRNNY